MLPLTEGRTGEWSREIDELMTNKLGVAHRWADHGISAVRFNGAGTHVERVIARPDYGDAIGTPCEYTRQNLISALKAGIRFVTILNTAGTGWTRGSEVRLTTIDGEAYLKIVEDCEESDFLGEVALY